MSPRYGLVALDLDGTALGADPEQFAPGLLEAAADAAAAGVEVLFATGRPRPCMPAQRRSPAALLAAYPDLL